MPKKTHEKAKSVEDPSTAGASGAKGIDLLDHPLNLDWTKPGEPYHTIKGTQRADGYATFELNVDKAMAEQFGHFFDSLAPTALTLEKLAGVPFGASGAYALYRVHDLGTKSESEELVYIGKSDSNDGLAVRLHPNTSTPGRGEMETLRWCVHTAARQRSD